jgi:hypothetical protein
MYQAITFIEQMIGSAVGGLGLLVLGLGIGWLTLYLLQNGEHPWGHSLIVFGIFALVLLLLVWMLPPGISGVYGLGVGAGLLVFGAWRRPVSTAVKARTAKKQGGAGRQDG